MLDLYEVLGVPEDATQDEIRRAYRAAARREHPDVSGRPDAAERMQSLNDAFAVLGDEKTRDAYDHGRMPPAGWGDERDPWDWERPRPRRRRAGRVLAVVLLAAGAAVAVVVLSEDERVQGRLPSEVVSAAVPVEEALAEPPPAPATGSTGLRSFVADVEGCSLWQDFDDHVARPVETLRDAVLLARAGPEKAGARRQAVQRMAPILAGASITLAKVVALIGSQEASRGGALPWRGVGAELSRAAVGLRERYDRFAATGRMPRAAADPVVRADQAVQRADELHARLVDVCAPVLAGS